MALLKDLWGTNVPLPRIVELNAGPCRSPGPQCTALNPESCSIFVEEGGGEQPTVVDPKPHFPPPLKELTVAHRKPPGNSSDYSETAPFHCMERDFQRGCRNERFFFMGWYILLSQIFSPHPRPRCAPIHETRALKRRHIRKQAHLTQAHTHPRKIDRERRVHGGEKGGCGTS